MNGLRESFYKKLGELHDLSGEERSDTLEELFEEALALPSTRERMQAL
ncbi:MAG: hypothetical protein JWO96_414, partial [Candidatus Saccharibacteria bacterium]|nr:hypothetical protein [Candidatus Saccharibacteria bacterium]